MLTDIKQSELDLLESKVMTAIFGGTTIDAKTQWLLNFLNIDINNIIQNFETIVRPMIKENGMVDINMVRGLLQDSYPWMLQVLPQNDFRLVDCADILIDILERMKQWKR